MEKYSREAGQLLVRARGGRGL